MPQDVFTDPREAGPRKIPPQQQPMPGDTDLMNPRPDHGEDSYIGHGRMKDKIAVITGADSGIGRAVAIAYAREGADVVVSYLQSDDDARETERLVKAAGRKCVLMRGDIGDENQCQKMIDAVFEQFGKLDVLVNNAAFQVTHKNVMDWSSEEFERAFRVNIFAMFYLCKAAMPRMKPGSVVINTASIQAYNPNPMLLGYSATKAAIVNFTKALGKTTNENGIRVNAVAPGPVWTPLIPSTFEADKVEKFGQDTAFGRAAQPAELAPAFVFLATNDSQFMTGEVLGVTGGKMPF